jgi:hypothetical protein
VGSCVRGSLPHKNGQSASFCCIVFNIINLKEEKKKTPSKQTGEKKKNPKVQTQDHTQMHTMGSLKAKKITKLKT